MPEPTRIALIGDYDANVIAHQAIPKAITLSATRLGIEVRPEWIHTSTISNPSEQFKAFAGIWCVPASPYANMDGVLAAIRWARESARPFLGTCGGFQHAVIEYARNVLGMADADHEETNPQASVQIISRLTCSLVEQTCEIKLQPGTRLHTIYGHDRATEGYHCNFGINPQFVKSLTRGTGLCIAAIDSAGEVRAVELTGHPFFVATLFQPERMALRDIEHPLVTAFLQAAISKAVD